MKSKHVIMISVIALLVLALVIVLLVFLPKKETVILTDNNSTTTSEQIEQEDTWPEPTKPAPGIPIEEYLWDKEREYFDLSTIKINKDWDSYITIGDAQISAINPVDISTVSNYFFNNQITPSKLQTAYNIPTKSFDLTTSENSLDFDFNTRFTISGTTMNYNVIVEGITFVGFTIPSNENLNKLKHSAAHTDDCFGIGSIYKDVVNLIGEPSSILIEPMSGFNLTKLVYKNENTKLILTFTWIGEYSNDGTAEKYDSNTLHSGVLTSIEWVPIKTKETLHTQDGIDSFLSYSEN